jgi:hypothetical protein
MTDLIRYISNIRLIRILSAAILNTENMLSIGRAVPLLVLYLCVLPNSESGMERHRRTNLQLGLSGKESA